MKESIYPVPPDCEIRDTRMVQATAAAVFKAWSRPVHLSRWWGPAGFTNTFHEFDFRVGGVWKFTMHGPERGHYENACIFTHIEPPHLIAWERLSKPLFRVVATFEEVDDGKTLVTFRQVFDSREACEKIRVHTVGKNDENFDRLEEELKRMC